MYHWLAVIAPYLPDSQPLVLLALWWLVRRVQRIERDVAVLTTHVDQLHAAHRLVGSNNGPRIVPGR